MITFELFKDWFGIIGNGCLLAISIYVFWRTFISKKIIFSGFSTHTAIIGGNSISVTVENKTLSPIVMTSICILAGDSFKIEIKNFDIPEILKPLSAKRYTTDPFSEISEAIDFSDLHKYSKEKRLRIEIHTSSGYLFDTFNPYHGQYGRKAEKIPLHTRYTKIYNGVIISPKIKYAIHLELPDRSEANFYLLSSGNFYKPPFPISNYPDIENSTTQTVTDFIKKDIPSHNGTVGIRVNDLKKSIFTQKASISGKSSTHLKQNFTCKFVKIPIEKTPIDKNDVNTI